MPSLILTERCRVNSGDMRSGQKSKSKPPDISDFMFTFFLGNLTRLSDSTIWSSGMWKTCSLGILYWYFAPDQDSRISTWSSDLISISSCVLFQLVSFCLSGAEFLQATFGGTVLYLWTAFGSTSPFTTFGQGNGTNMTSPPESPAFFTNCNMRLQVISLATCRSIAKHSETS